MKMDLYKADVDEETGEFSRTFLATIEAADLGEIRVIAWRDHFGSDSERFNECGRLFDHGTKVKLSGRVSREYQRKLWERRFDKMSRPEQDAYMNR